MRSHRLTLAGLLSLLLLLAGLSAAQAADPVLVLDTTELNASQRQLAASLQGVANRAPEGPRVFLQTRPSDAEWLAFTVHLDPRPVQNVTLEELLAQVKPRLQGQVLYDPAQPYTLEVATLAAGVRSAAISDTDLGLTTIFDFRKRFDSARGAYSWAISSLLPQGNRKQVALLSAESSAMRDYAVQQKLLTLSPASGLTQEELQDLLFHLTPGTVFFGAYAPELLPTLSEASDYLMPAAETANLSFYSTLVKDTRFYQYPGHVEPVAPRYLTLVFDCSDVDSAVNRMSELWEDPARGTLPLGWALPGALAAVAPPVVRRYYAEAYRGGSDQFVLGINGAGFMDLARAASPEAFYQAVNQGARALDAHTCLLEAPAAPERIGEAVAGLTAGGGVTGVFLLNAADQGPAIYGGTVPAVATPYINSVEQAITYLNRIPLDRRFAALCLNAATMTPEDAAHIAEHVASRYLVVPPAEFMALMLSVARGEQPGEAAVKVSSAEFPEGTLAPDQPVPVRAEIQPADQLYSAEVVYRPAGSRLAFSSPLRPSGNGFGTELSPLRWGGEVELKVRAVDTQGRVAWSPTWTVQVARSDKDGDGLSDAEEAYLLTDPERADTDGDGLLDANDPRPLIPDVVPVIYFGPLFPPSDVPYLTNPTESSVEAGGRLVAPGKSASYWLPLGRVPPKASATVRVEASGQVEIALGAEAGALTPRYTGEVTGVWQSEPLPIETYPSGVFLRVTCPAQAGAPLTLFSVTVTSPAGAPSVVQVQHSPAAPGPDQPITLSAVAFAPEGVTEVSATYRLNGDKLATLPMAAEGQRYVLALPLTFDNRDVVEYWVTAQGKTGARTSTAPRTLVIGGRGREVVTLRARQNFVGGWRPSSEWEREASYAPETGVQDTAPANLTGGSYTVWVLAGGRGNGIAVSVDGKPVGAIEPDRPDGWQQVGWVRLEAGKHRVTLTAQAAPRAAVWTEPRYAAVTLSTDTTFTPPAEEVLDVLNSLTLLSPRRDTPLTGVVELHATGAGNLLGVEISLDGTVVRRVTGPPFTFSLSTARYANGPHTLRLEAVDRTGTTGMVLEVPVTIAN